MNADENLTNKLNQAAADVGRIPSVADDVMRGLQATSHASPSFLWRGLYMVFAHRLAAAAAASLLLCIGAAVLFLAVSSGSSVAWGDVTTKMTNSDSVVFWLSDWTSLRGAPLETPNFNRKMYVKSPHTVRAETWADQRPWVLPSDEKDGRPTGVTIFDVPCGQDKANFSMIDERHWVRTLQIGQSPRERSMRNRPEDLLRALKNIQANEVAREGEETIDGVETVRFAAKLPQDLLLDAIQLPRRTSGDVIIWAEKKSALPIRIRLLGTVSNFPPGKGDMAFDFMLEKIEWNVPLDDSLFQPPDTKGLEIVDAYWTICSSKAISEKKFTLSIRLDGGELVASEKDGSISPFPGGFKFFLDSHHKKALAEFTGKHLSETLVIEVSGEKFERKILRPVQDIFVECYSTGLATQPQSSSASQSH